MDKTPLDRQTADRLLAGNLDPDDAPPGWAPVASLLRAAAGPVDPVELPHDESTVAAMVTVLAARSPASGGVGSRPGSRRSRWWRAKLVAVAVGCTLAATAGLAFAGALPAPAQDAVSTVLAKIGISVPRHTGPKVPGPSLKGLCQASASGQGGTHGNRDDAVPFQNLQGGAGDVCSTATPGNAGGNGNAPGQGKHGPAVPTPNVVGPGKGNDSSGDAGSNGSGNAPSNPGRSADG